MPEFEKGSLTVSSGGASLGPPLLEISEPKLRDTGLLTVEQLRATERRLHVRVQDAADALRREIAQQIQTAQDASTTAFRDLQTRNESAEHHAADLAERRAHHTTDLIQAHLKRVLSELATIDEHLQREATEQFQQIQRTQQDLGKELRLRHEMAERQAAERAQQSADRASENVKVVASVVTRFDSHVTDVMGRLDQHLSNIELRTIARSEEFLRLVGRMYEDLEGRTLEGRFRRLWLWMRRLFQRS